MENFEKYIRQTSLGNFGLVGQKKLARASVVLIGAGGVGGAALPILAGSGIGRIVVFDGDVVSEHNLHRQTIYRAQDVGKPKAELAANFARGINPDCEVEYHAERFDEYSLDSITCDICVDASDSFASRQSVAKACRKRGINAVSATAEGYVSQNFLFGEGFYFDDIVGADSVSEQAKSLPIFPPAAHLSGVWAAAEVVKAIVLGKFEIGAFRMFDHLTMKYFSGNIK